MSELSNRELLQKCEERILGYDWFELTDMSFDRKLALMDAWVDINHRHVYDSYTVEDLQTLKYHIRTLEGYTDVYSDNGDWADIK